MKSVYEKKEACCGCGLCRSLCPAGAIGMEPDTEGFSYPVIDAKLCGECGLCRRSCPFFRNGHYKREEEPEFFAVKHHSEQVLRSSSSGGAFTALSDTILAQGGVVYGAAFDDDLRVHHIRGDCAAQRDLMRGSKYVQSYMGEQPRLSGSVHYPEQRSAFWREFQLSGLESAMGGAK